ncbi:uncharacterized protein LOC18994135 isoform X2 [Eutrema salsugineum]|uniref:uncharacterized protein LOC18994135 isoform X2 n=1 Tax=Eutrema salsugineum TaxID=72664 RepID=UPI000CED7B63|nr:uncharacterized protein LOC18994135 isoform X2 [Eutrema salsugineum]
MGIDAKDVGTLVWKILRISTTTVYTYVRKHPLVSGVSAVIFLLYKFLPWFFYFVLCSSPFIACSAFYLRNHLNFKPLNIKSIKTVSQKGSEEGGSRKADLKHQRSVRRNARRKVEEVGKDWDSSQASEDERDKVILITLYGEFPNTTRKSPQLQKFKKDRTFLVSEDFSFEPSLDEETHSTTGNVSIVDPSSERLTSGGGETEIECSSSSSSSSSSEGEEETVGEDKNVVAWTEDDQKNLMDLGNSEMERNKRLEHLITRRRTRRLFLLAAERSLIDMEVPSICVGRNYFGLDQENYVIDALQMPESAPCVLLPTKNNPFDLPYDPQEERPNLSGDSFQQEFSADKPNESFFCRHESFSRKLFPSEIQVDSRMEPWKNSIDVWPRPQQGTNDGLVGEKPPLTEGKYVIRAEANDMESEHRTEIVVSASNSLPSPGESEMDSKVSNQERTLGKPIGDHRVGNSLMGMIPRNTRPLSSSLAAERQIYMEHFGYSSGKGHMVTQSVESDLQVEFSEMGSPPTTVDGNYSSDDEKSLFVFDSDTGKGTDFSGEENDAKQKSIVDKAEHSQLLPVEKVDQDFNETSSIVSPETDVAKHFEGLSDGTDVNVVRSEEEERSKSRHSLLESSDRGLHISEEATVPHNNEVVSQREEESQELLQNSVDEMKISYDSDEPEPSERSRTNQEVEDKFLRNDGGQSTEEMEEMVQAQASDVNHVTSNESATSPRSVLPDLSIPLGQPHTLTSENLELTPDSQPRAIIPEPDSPQNQGQSESSEEVTEDHSNSNAIVPLVNTEHETHGSAVISI